MKKTKNAIVATNAFSLAEALITLLVICVIAIASAPVITKKHKARINLPHGVYACYWNGDNLVAKYIINGQESDGKVVFDSEEQRYGCEFNTMKMWTFFFENSLFLMYLIDNQYQSGFGIGIVFSLS